MKTEAEMEATWERLEDVYWDKYEGVRRLSFFIDGDGMELNYRRHRNREIECRKYRPTSSSLERLGYLLWRPEYVTYRDDFVAIDYSTHIEDCFHPWSDDNAHFD